MSKRDPQTYSTSQRNVDNHRFNNNKTLKYEAKRMQQKILRIDCHKKKI